MAHSNHIDNITFVVKAFAGNLSVIEAILNSDVTSIGDSRIMNLKKMQDLPVEKVLLRIPMLSEVSEVIQYADVSLNSEWKVIEALNREAARQNKKHDVIIMFDLGDLREGIYYDSDYIGLIGSVLRMTSINLLGIGTNLTCYGGLVPSRKILDRLVDIKHRIESEFGIKLSIISGGNSSSVTLFGQDAIPSEINHLRLGESILFGKETSYSTNIKGLHHDVFKFEAEIIELKNKPSYPDGDISINSFGEVPRIEDKGRMNRAILAIGKQDVILDNLAPTDSDITIIGGSSDHLIIEIRNDRYQVGDIVAFDINYPALVHLMNSDYVNKKVILR